VEVKPTGPEHFDSLLEDDGMAASDEAVADEPGDSAAGGGAGRGIFPAVELHAGVPVGYGGFGGAGDAEEEHGAGSLQKGPGGVLRDLETAATSSDRRGTMQKGMPVDTVWAGAAGSRSPGARLRAAAMLTGSWRSPKTGSFWRIVAKTPGSVGLGGRKVTGMRPAWRSRWMVSEPRRTGWLV